MLLAGDAMAGPAVSRGTPSSGPAADAPKAKKPKKGKKPKAGPGKKPSNAAKPAPPGTKSDEDDDARSGALVAPAAKPSSGGKKPSRGGKKPTSHKPSSSGSSTMVAPPPKSSSSSGGKLTSSGSSSPKPTAPKSASPKSSSSSAPPPPGKGRKTHKTSGGKKRKGGGHTHTKARTRIRGPGSLRLGLAGNVIGQEEVGTTPFGGLDFDLFVRGKSKHIGGFVGGGGYVSGGDSAGLFAFGARGLLFPRKQFTPTADLGIGFQWINGDKPGALDESGPVTGTYGGPMARVGFDYSVTPGLSIHGSLGGLLTVANMSANADSPNSVGSFNIGLGSTVWF